MCHGLRPPYRPFVRRTIGQPGCRRAREGACAAPLARPVGGCQGCKARRRALQSWGIAGEASYAAEGLGRIIAPRRARHRGRAGLARAEVHPAIRPGDPGPDLDHRLRDAQPWLPGVRHALRPGRAVQGAAADGGRCHDGGRRQGVAADAAQRAEIPRRHAGAGARLRGQPDALGQAGRVRPGAVRRDGRAVGARRQDGPVPPEEALSAAAGRAGQDGQQHPRDHAGAAGQDRPVHPGDGNGRQRPIPLQGRRAGGRLARGVRAVRRLRAARQRHAVVHRRAEGGELRPRRMERHPGFRHRRQRHAERRDGLVGEPARRPAAAAEAQRQAERAGAGPDGFARLHAPQLPVPAVR